MKSSFSIYERKQFCNAYISFNHNDICWYVIIKIIILNFVFAKCVFVCLIICFDYCVAFKSGKWFGMCCIYFCPPSPCR